jgi:monofunctional biosynthetic peptidoglycan transglycosylase
VQEELDRQGEEEDAYPVGADEAREPEERSGQKPGQALEAEGPEAVDEDALEAGEAPLRGASTIPMQTAKNLFLWRGPSYLRKGLEAWFTLLIEWLWPKQRILEIYLNVAEFGPGVYGVGAAAPRFFRTPPAGISRAEGALLAAVLPNPRRFRVDRPSAYVLRRQAWIIGQMNALGGAEYMRDVEAD